MPFFIDDGYTLIGQTSGTSDEGIEMPVVNFSYRPPLASEMTAFRFKVQSAQTAEQVHEARCKFLLARLVSWDVVGKDKKSFPITEAAFDKLPYPIVQDLVIECAKWKIRSQEEAAGNSKGE